MLATNLQSWMIVSFLGHQKLSKELPATDWTAGSYGGGGQQLPPSLSNQVFSTDTDTYTEICASLPWTRSYIQCQCAP